MPNSFLNNKKKTSEQKNLSQLQDGNFDIVKTNVNIATANENILRQSMPSSVSINMKLEKSDINEYFILLYTRL